MLHIIEREREKKKFNINRKNILKSDSFFDGTLTHHYFWYFYLLKEREREKRGRKRREAI